MRSIIAPVVVMAFMNGLRADEEKISLDKLPKTVKESVQKRFPKSTMDGAVKETENGKTAYEVTIRDGGNRIEISVTGDGITTGMEKEIPLRELPKVVTEAVASKYPNSKLKKAEEVITVKDDKESLEWYEVTIEQDGKAVEVEILPNGKLKPMEKK